MKKNEMIRLLENDGYYYFHLDDKFKVDKDIVMAAVSESGNLLRDMNNQFKDDKEIVLAAVKENSLALEYASERLKSDKEVVMEAIKGDYWAFRYVSNELKHSKEFVIAVIEVITNPCVIYMHCSEKMQRDADVIELVNNNLLSIGEVQTIDNLLCNELVELKKKYGVDKLKVALEMESADFEVNKLMDKVNVNLDQNNKGKRIGGRL